MFLQTSLCCSGERRVVASVLSLWSLDLRIHPPPHSLLLSVLEHQCASLTQQLNMLMHSCSTASLDESALISVFTLTNHSTVYSVSCEGETAAH